jgi:hypothetical protein
MKAFPYPRKGLFYETTKISFILLPMRSYLESHLYYISPIFAAIAFLAGLTIFRGDPTPKYLKVFFFFLLVNLITEAISSIQAADRINNLIFVNLVTVFDFAIYIYLFREIIRSRFVKSILLYALLIYPAIFLINTLLIQGSVVFHSMTYALGCLLIIFSCIFYLWEMFQRTYSVNLARQQEFWICCGLLFYYTCTFPVYGAANLLNGLPMVIKKNLLFILTLLSILLYLSFTVAFLCRPRNRKSMS